MEPYIAFLSVNQYGFLNIEKKLVSYSQYILLELDYGFQIDSIYTDFAKAFHSTNHYILMEKKEILWLY